MTMTKRLYAFIAAIACTALAFCAPPARTSDSLRQKPPRTPQPTRIEPVDNTVYFAWGADAGTSIDLTGNDMSAINFNAVFGMRRSWINFLGAGVGADISISNSTRSYPIFLEFRTNFRQRPSLVFFDVRAGMAYNQLEHNHNQFGVFVNTGPGINLARSSKFCSYISLSYTFKQRKKVVGTEMTHDFKNLHFVTARIGVTF